MLPPTFSLPANHHIVAVVKPQAVSWFERGNRHNNDGPAIRPATTKSNATWRETYEVQG